MYLEEIFMLKCSKCGCKLEEKDALVHKDQEGKDNIICHSCFKEATGVDYETFAFRKENAKQTFFAVLFFPSLLSSPIKLAASRCHHCWT